MRILLVKAACSDRRHMDITPPLGIMYLSACMRKEGHELSFFDMRLVPEGSPSLAGKLAGFRPDIVGISSMSVEKKSAHEAARIAREVLGSECRVVMGGPHPTVSPREALADPNVDFAVMGEGETTFGLLVRELARGSGDFNIPGLGVRAPELRINGPAPPVEDLDALPFPDWETVGVETYFKQSRNSSLKNRPYIPVFTSRACPYGCIYCHNLFGKKFRVRSPESMVEEIRQAVSLYGVEEIEVLDDIFNLDRERAIRFFDLLKERGLRIRISFPNGLRSDLLDEDMLARMKDAGVYYIAFAVETASPRLQKFIRKNLDLKKAKQAIKIARKLHITSNGYFMLGFPTETGREMLRTIWFACSSRLNFATFFTVRCFPGTRLDEWVRESGYGLSPERQRKNAESLYQVPENNLSRMGDRLFLWISRLANTSFYSGGLTRILLSGAYRDVRLKAGAALFLRKLFA